MSSSLPDKIYAKCPVCGSGGDTPAASLTDADAQSNIDTVDAGEYLVWYEGELMCPLCKQNRINRQQSDVVAERCAEEQDWRDRVGFKRQIT